MPKDLILRGIAVSVRLSPSEHEFLCKRQEALGLVSLSAALRSLIPSVTHEHVEAFEARVAALEKDVAELKLGNSRVAFGGPESQAELSSRVPGPPT